MNNTSNNNNTSEDTLVYIPRKILKNMELEQGAKEKTYQEKLNILQNAIKKRDDKLKNIDGGEQKNIIDEEKKKEIENNNISEHSQISVSSIFKKKENTKSDKNNLSQQGGNKNNNISKSHKSEEKSKKKVVDLEELYGTNKFLKNIDDNIKNADLYYGGNKSDKHKDKNHIKSESESEDEEESETDDENSEKKSSEYTDSNSSTEYEDTSDIYRATETDDGINKAYSKINREMEEIERKQNKGKMTGKEVVKRINFLLNGLRILDNVEKNNKKKKH